MERSEAEIYLHLVWAMRGRPRPALDAGSPVFRHIGREVSRLGGVVLAVGAMPDHVHLLAGLPTTVGAARVMRMAEGVSSRLARPRRADGFDGQDSYAVFSVSRSHLNRVTAYLLNQKRHPGDDFLWTEWERIRASAHP